MLERATWQFDVFVQFVHFITDNGHSTVALHQFKIEVSTQEPGFGFHRIIEPACITECISVSSVERYYVNATQQNVHAANHQIRVAPNHIRVNKIGGTVTSDGQFVYIGLGRNNRERIVGSGIQVVTIYAVVSITHVIVDAVEVFTYYSSVGVGLREEIIFCKHIYRRTLITVCTCGSTQ